MNISTEKIKILKHDRDNLIDNLENIIKNLKMSDDPKTILKELDMIRFNSHLVDVIFKELKYKIS